VTAEWQAAGHFEAARSPFGGESLRYRLYGTADGGHLAVGALEQKFWQRFCAVVGIDPATASAETIEELVRSRTTAEWQEAFAPEDCCVSVLGGASTLQWPTEPLHLPVLSLFRTGPAESSVLLRHGARKSGSGIC